MTPDLKTLLRDRCLTLTRLADLMAIDKATASRWAKNGIPAERVIAVENATGISREDLRPDLYPPPADAPREVCA